MNRLKSAQGRWGVGSFEYDAFGNLTLMALGAETHRIDYNGLRLRSVVHNDATRSWYAHDAYGNVRSDTEIAGTGTVGSLIKRQQYLYDDAGRLHPACCWANIPAGCSTARSMSISASSSIASPKTNEPPRADAGPDSLGRYCRIPVASAHTEAATSLNGRFLHWFLIPKGLREHDSRIEKCTVFFQGRL